MGNNTNSSPGNGVKNENSLGKEEMEHERLGQISYQEEEGEDDEQRQYMSINVHVESKKAWDDWERDYRKVDDS